MLDMKKNAPTTTAEFVAALRRAERQERVAALRDGRKVRATTFADRRKVADKRACRDRRAWA
jgi:hypothetical protein